MDNRIQEKPYISNNYVASKMSRKGCGLKNLPVSKPSGSVSFRGGNADKYFWLGLKRASGWMKEITEYTNALIAAFGTGIIAPLIIECSPGKGDKEDKEKKFFQAIRQPLSAGLALGFQVPATYAVNKGLDALAYKDNEGVMKNPTVNKYVHKFFDDEVLGALIPDKKYIKKLSSSKQDAANLETEFNAPKSELKKKLENQVIAEYREVGLEISEDKLAKEVQKKKKKFLLNEAVDRKYKSLIEEKCNELKGKNIEINPNDLVSDSLKNTVETNYKKELEAIEKEMNLSFFDKTLKLIGFGNKKLKALKDRQDNYKVEKGVEILREKESSIFEDAELKLKKFVEARNDKAQKGFKQQRFFISLLINIAMVTASCYALNWLHPRFKEWMDKRKSKENENSQSMEVRA